MTPAQMTSLRRAFVDVCNRYSTATLNGSPIYIRHLSHREYLEYDNLSALFSAEAQAKGAPSHENRLAELISKGLWSNDREQDIATRRETITRFEDGKKQLPIPSMVKKQEEQIAQMRKDLDLILIEKGDKMGITAEVYAQQRLNDHYIVFNLFKDAALTQPLYDNAAFEDLSDTDVEIIMRVYKVAIDPCADASLKTLSVQDFFIGYYNLCADDLSSFFGIPIAQMTYYQVRLGNYARYFKSLAENTDLTKLTREQRADPAEIERAHSTQQKHGQMQAAGQVPVGMSKDDIEKAGMKGQFSPLPKQSLSGGDFIKFIAGQPQNQGR